MENDFQIGIGKINGRFAVIFWIQKTQKAKMRGKVNFPTILSRKNKSKLWKL